MYRITKALALGGILITALSLSQCRMRMGGSRGGSKGLPSPKYYLSLVKDQGYMLFWKPQNFKGDGQKASLDYTVFVDQNYVLTNQDSIDVRFTWNTKEKQNTELLPSIGLSQSGDSLLFGQFKTVFLKPTKKSWEWRLEAKICKDTFLKNYLAKQDRWVLHLGGLKLMETSKHYKVRGLMRQMHDQ